MPRLLKIKSLFSRLTKRRSSKKASEQSAAPTSGSNSSSSGNENASVCSTATVAVAGRARVVHVESTNKVVYRQLNGSRFAENLPSNAVRCSVRSNNTSTCSPPVSPADLAAAFSSCISPSPLSFPPSPDSPLSRVDMAAALSASAPRAPSPPVSPAELALAISAAMSPFDPFDIPEFNDANEAVPADDDGIMGTPPPPYTAVSSPPPPYEARDPRWLWEGVCSQGCAWCD
ncbi:hypothetical protein HDK90DRAFT_462249 [Phyllosticta capitalensis]|uniref:Uncharacterized protein n=1 Tax=Phyllosticta capitalensis TaxID=121624 RepID=A0ABR1Z5B7_9PEZI